MNNFSELVVRVLEGHLNLANKLKDEEYKESFGRCGSVGPPHTLEP